MSISKSQTEKIGSILNGNRFEIPKYQRKYSWTELEVRALWQDIEESMKDNMNHFIGTLSFKENKTVGLSTDKVYEIIDGQQRITTLFILLKVLIERIKNKKIQNEQMNTFIGSENNLKLQPLGEDGDFLKKVLFHFEMLKPDNINKRSQKFMYMTKKIFIDFSRNLNDSEIEQKIIYILERIDVLVFNVDSQAQAVKMFSIINDRGLPLRILDKTKSILMLYSTLHLKERLNNLINDSFETIFDSYDDILVLIDKLKILGRFEENTIFTHHYYSSRKLFPQLWNNRDGADTIFDNLKFQCEELKEKPKKLEGFIINYLKDFELFSSFYSQLIKEISTKNIYQKPFRYLGFTATMYPLIIRLYMQNKLDSLLKLMETIEVRVYKLRGTNPIADVYLLSSDISENNLSIDDIHDRLINFCEKFMSNHVFRSYLEADIYGNGAVKYILSEYSKDNLSIENYSDLTVEHIFSDEPNYEPSSYGFDENYDYEKNRIGNLTLLEPKLNKGIGNDPPKNKVSAYLKSNINSTRILAGEIQKGNFNKKNIDERQKNIIDFCIKRFKII
jgi:uncharacterized protein with ParB-like and HNH nuclease domain